MGCIAYLYIVVTRDKRAEVGVVLPVKTSIDTVLICSEPP